MDDAGLGKVPLKQYFSTSTILSCRISVPRIPHPGTCGGEVQMLKVQKLRNTALKTGFHFPCLTSA